MGRGDDSNDPYGGLYSPSQSLALASQQGQDLVNPLTTPANPASIAPTGQPESTVNTNAFNPLLQPAFPIASMSPERQQRWMDVTQQAQTNQAAIDKAAMDMEISRREQAHKDEVRRQSLELINRSNELDPADLKGYPIARAKLARDFALGAGSEEVQRALKPLDDAFSAGRSLDTDYQKQLNAQVRLEENKRLDDARKTAIDLGPDQLADFFNTQKNEGTEAAIQKVTQAAAGVKQSNLIAQLKNAGLTEEQIQEKYGGGTTGEPFKYAAAEYEAKQKVNPKLDHDRAVATFLQLQKQRDLDGTDPEKWTDLHEKAYQDSLIDVDQTGARVFNRAGVQGFDPVKAKADKAEQDRKDKEAKDREAQAKAAQAGYFTNLGNAILGNRPTVPLPPVTPPVTPPVAAPPVAPPIATPTPTPAGGYPAAPASVPVTRPVAATSPVRALPTATNPKTKKQMVYRNGRWEDI
jgi:hypothetical protein